MADLVTVARLEDVPPGTVKTFFVGDQHLALANVEGEIYAIQDVCTHDGGQLTGGTIEGDQIVCPRHGARFCVRTGEALSAPAYEPTAKFPVRVENGEVQVKDDRWD